MTYIEAVKNNERFKLPNTYKNPKEISEGKHLRWVKSPDGKIGFILKGKADEFLVGYPTKVLKNSCYLTVECYPSKEFKSFEKL